MSTFSQTQYFDAVSAGLGHRYHLEQMVEIQYPKKEKLLQYE